MVLLNVFAAGYEEAETAKFLQETVELEVRLVGPDPNASVAELGRLAATCHLAWMLLGAATRRPRGNRGKSLVCGTILRNASASRIHDTCWRSGPWSRCGSSQGGGVTSPSGTNRLALQSPAIAEPTRPLRIGRGVMAGSWPFHRLGAACRRAGGSVSLIGSGNAKREMMHFDGDSPLQNRR